MDMVFCSWTYSSDAFYSAGSIFVRVRGQFKIIVTDGRQLLPFLPEHLPYTYILVIEHILVSNTYLNRCSFLFLSDRSSNSFSSPKNNDCIISETCRYSVGNFILLSDDQHLLTWIPTWLRDYRLVLVTFVTPMLSQPEIRVSVSSSCIIIPYEYLVEEED